MTTVVAKLTEIQQRLDALARQHAVPGASLSIGMGGEQVDFATGVLNVNTGVATTTDSIFQIGSNTKLFTATLVMQLVDAGRIDLDEPVKRYLPNFEVDDDTAADEITTRHLLTHTSGIQGDYFDGFGRGDDAIERYVDSLREIDLVHRPGQQWSYCNSGYVVAGRLAEKVTGVPYHELLRDRICGPAGLDTATVRVEEMVAHRCAVGHVLDSHRKPSVPAVVVMEYAQAPAGSVTAATAAELVRFVQMHLHDGKASNGRQVLSPESARAMRRVQFNRPAVSSALQTQGLGWRMEEWDGKAVVGHGGGTIGQLSFLESIPEDQLVIALLTNSAAGGYLWRDLGGWLFEELADVQMAPPLKPPDAKPDLPLDRYAGTYERLGLRNVVKVHDDHLVMSTEYSGALADLQQVSDEPVRLQAIDHDRFLAERDGDDWVVAFLEFERGRPRFFFSSRLARRTGSRSRRPTARSGT